ncbi:hypothetical protein BECAL_02372 [Bellilinea caldifistulae]|uniref:hypothetical protein n=1 Tax=Bellilinea caldifistulae TaxID=360411 RepID=UPI000785F816|nr:hypothetical protein [Bellilinea caldifistulae]GAP11186.1 hypothetical protein BECAL_02372 [Bellilinea caldifistulae]
MPPRLIFFCELDTPQLRELFQTNEVLDALQKLGAGVALAIRDFSDERAQVVCRMNEAGIPVTAWLLLPEEQGYWFNLDNAPLAVQRYADFKAWSEKKGLKWQRIGLDIEPDFRLITALKEGVFPFFKVLFLTLKRRKKLFSTARKMYEQLIEQIHADGYEVEAYQLPPVLEERRTRSSVLQRWLGILDLAVDREILMLYSSFSRPWGDAMLLSYGKDAQYVAIGSTGGGVDLEGVADTRPLDWQEFSRDLLIAGLLKPEVAVFSLEGCVHQGFLERLEKFDWQQSIQVERKKYVIVQQVRQLLAAKLWLLERPWLPAVIFLLLILLQVRRRRNLD